MNRLSNLEFIINYLKAEDSRFSGLQLPESLRERQQLMRALLNVREPKPISHAFLEAQDAELQQQKADKGVVATDGKNQSFVPMNLNGKPPGVDFLLWQGDITRLDADTIVNAANSQMLGCFRPLHNCIDNAIHSAAGVQLRLECASQMQQLGREADTGEAIITRGYNLPARHVIHTVGPIIPNGRPTPGQEVELANCYRNSLQLAESHHLGSIAFCCISTGVFMFPQRCAAEVATSAVSAWLNTHQSGIRKVIFNVFKESDYDIYKSLC